MNNLRSTYLSSLRLGAPLLAEASFAINACADRLSCTRVYL